MNTLQAGNEGAGDVEGVEESFQKKLVGVGWSRRRLDTCGRRGQVIEEYGWPQKNWGITIAIWGLCEEVYPDLNGSDDQRTYNITFNIRLYW